MKQRSMRWVSPMQWVCALVALVVVFLGGLQLLAATPSAAQGADAAQQVDEQETVLATAVSQRFEDGPEGTVVTLTEMTTVDQRTLVVKTLGGVRSDGVVQITSAQAELTVGHTYEIQVVNTGETFSLVGGALGAQRVLQPGEVGVAVNNNVPGNFTLEDWNWNWTLPNNPPQFMVNPNSTDISNEVELITQAFQVWEDDPGSLVDFNYGGLSTLEIAAEDGTNLVFWADTPNAADTYLAQTTTWFNAAGDALESDTVFNNDYGWFDGASIGYYDVVTVGIHEVGHTLGLDHAPNNAAIMYFEILSNRVHRELSQGDRGGVALLYPAGPACTVANNADGSVTVSWTDLGAAGYDVAKDAGAPIWVTDTATTDFNPGTDYTVTGWGGALPGNGVPVSCTNPNPGGGGLFSCTVVNNPNGSATVSWLDLAAAGYDLVIDGNPAIWVTAVAYTDLSAGTNYGVTAWGNGAGGNTTSCTNPNPGGGFSCTVSNNANGSVTVSWSDLAANGYDVLKDAGTPVWVTGLSFTDFTPGTDYSVTGWGNGAGGTSASCTNPNPGGGGFSCLVVANADGSVTVSWPDLGADGHDLVEDAAAPVWVSANSYNDPTPGVGYSITAWGNGTNGNTTSC